MAAITSTHSSFTLQVGGLSFVEQILLWLVRTTVSGGAEATSRTAGQLFNASELAHTARALDALRATLQRSPLGPGLVRPPCCRAVSSCEHDLLHAVSQAQAEGDIAELVDSWGWPAPDDVDQVCVSLCILADSLLAVDAQLPVAAGRPVVGIRAEMTIGALDPRERVLVDGCRLWSLCVRQQRDGLAALRDLFCPASLPAVAAPLDAVLMHAAVAGMRPLELACRTSKDLCADEARLLHAVSMLQRGRAELCFELLADFLMPAAVRATLPAVGRVAAALEEAGHRLPLRAWQFPELGGRATWPASTGAHPRATLH